MAAPTMLVRGELAIRLNDRVLVQSKSKPGQWHEVKDGACDCESFGYRKRCRHIDIAAECTEAARAFHVEPAPRPKTNAEQVAEQLAAKAASEPEPAPIKSVALCSDCEIRIARAGSRCGMCHSRWYSELGSNQ